MKKLLLLAAAAALAACAHPSRWLDQGQLKDRLEETTASSSYYQAIGIGAADPAAASDTQRRALARDAAIVKAQYELLSRIEGVEVEGGLTVKRAIETDSSLETRVRSVLRHAEVVRSEFTKDNGCVVTLRLSKKELAQALAGRPS